MKKRRPNATGPLTKEELRASLIEGLKGQIEGLKARRAAYGKNTSAAGYQTLTQEIANAEHALMRAEETQ